LICKNIDFGCQKYRFYLAKAMLLHLESIAFGKSILFFNEIDAVFSLTEMLKQRNVKKSDCKISGRKNIDL
jgi:hypothetical protein